MSGMESATFNLLEGLWWVSLGLMTLGFVTFVSPRYRALAMVSACLLIVFGVSDFVQVRYGSFLVSGMEWLWYWKIGNVVGLCSMVLWYLWLRLKS